MALKPGGTGYTTKSTTSRDGGTGGSPVNEAGTGRITKSKSGGSDADRGRRGVPTDTGHATGLAKSRGGSESVSRKPDGVGGPLPHA